jgi:hypothetical protein
MRHKICNTKIEEYKTEEGMHYHPFFVGYCPKCDIAVTRQETKN